MGGLGCGGAAGEGACEGGKGFYWVGGCRGAAGAGVVWGGSRADGCLVCWVVRRSGYGVEDRTLVVCRGMVSGFERWVVWGFGVLTIWRDA